MSYDILIDERAVTELSATVSWYHDQSVTAAEKFETAFKWVLDTPRTDRIDYSVFIRDIMKAPVPDFPYYVYYSRIKETTCVYIHAVLHVKRGPDFSAERLFQ